MSPFSASLLSLFIITVLLVPSVTAQMSHSAGEITGDGTIASTLRINSGSNSVSVGNSPPNPQETFHVFGNARIGSSTVYAQLQFADSSVYIDSEDGINLRLITPGASILIDDRVQVSGDISLTGDVDGYDISESAPVWAADSDTGNELQTLSASSGTVTLSDSGGSVTCEEITGDAGLCDGVDDVGLTSYTDTNAETECDGTNVYLDGDGNCDTITATTDTNANTLCAGTDFYLDGEGNCDLITDTNTNAATLCSSGEYLGGGSDGCLDIPSGGGSGDITSVTGSAPLTFSGCTSGTCTLGFQPKIGRARIPGYSNTYFTYIGGGTGYSSNPADLVVNNVVRNDPNFDLEVLGQGKVLLSSSDDDAGGAGLIYFPDGGSFYMRESGESSASGYGENSNGEYCNIFVIDGGAEGDWCDGSEKITVSSGVEFEIGCPSGFTSIKRADNQLGCMQTSENGVANWRTAMNNCFTSYGGRLPTLNEWFISIYNYNLNNEADDWELTGNIERLPSVIMVDYDSGYSPAINGLRWSTGNMQGNSYAYRCWIPR